ncbi:acetyl-CoA hydrolase/transferase C-terminal domain-containing protein [Halosolutus amylolyticus]|uniref:Acetyl-CoA hydrolase/transferase C-terminal domain-containing protein n=1 Tax=Halosolutus amylolyticus TaxID=2932267 RepID=A0ABD5PIZ7_9EURY|nr:acetyl-CoA hydrolase/transferase C-terminal domain-containing protein [Halosolutus amylolyticus]
MVTPTNATRAAAQIRPGDEIVVDTSRPTATLESALERDDLRDVVVTVFGYPYADSSLLRALANHDGISVQLSMVPSGVRDLVTDGDISYVPRTVYQTAQSPALRPNRRTVGIVQTPPGTDDEDHPIGCLSTFGRSLVETGDVTIVETNPRVPSPTQSGRIERSKIDHLLSSESGLPTLDLTTSDVAADIAENLRPLVPETATVQLGVGGLMESIGERLATGGPYSLWTGLVGESVRPMVENECVTRATGCVAIGSTESFYDWVQSVEDIRFVSGSVSHAPAKLTEQTNLVAINSALQVDLTGQINAETLGGRQVAGVGGQSAFMTAASNDPEGRAIIALESRASNGISKIIGALPDREIVTTPRYAIDAVVTEYGVARLTGRTTRERASDLVAVAHPDDRTELREAAREYGLR